MWVCKLPPFGLSVFSFFYGTHYPKSWYAVHRKAVTSYAVIQFHFKQVQFSSRNTNKLLFKVKRAPNCSCGRFACTCMGHILYFYILYLNGNAKKSSFCCYTKRKAKLRPYIYAVHKLKKEAVLKGGGFTFICF